MNEINFFGDVHWEGQKEFFECEVPYIFNLEYVVETANGIPAINKINIVGSGEFQKWRKPPIAVNLANNHIMDLGDNGFLHTIEALQENGIAFFGAGTEENNYHNPCILQIRDKKVGFLGYMDYDFLLEKSQNKNKCAEPTAERIKKDIQICRKMQVDTIIANVHWGKEERSWHNSRQEKWGHLLVDEGVNLVIGHHPHCIQPMEKYKGSYIFYSLGNTYFPDLCTPSYYDENGNSEFVVRTRNLKCGRMSLRVNYNLTQNKVANVIKMEYKNGRIFEREEVLDKPVVSRMYRFPVVNELVGYVRRIIILLRSNFFVDGKFVNKKAIIKEFAFITARREKEK